MCYNNVMVSLDIDKDNDKQWILEVVKNGNVEAVVTFPSSKLPVSNKKSMKWDELKIKIDTTKEKITKQRNKSKQTDTQQDKMNEGWEERQKNKGNKIINDGCGYNVDFNGNKNSCIVKISFPDTLATVVTCSDGKVIKAI